MKPKTKIIATSIAMAIVASITIYCLFTGNTIGLVVNCCVLLFQSFQMYFAISDYNFEKR